MLFLYACIPFFSFEDTTFGVVVIYGIVLVFGHDVILFIHE